MNTKTPDIRLLRCFQVLMAERNVSRAAGRLQLSQPAMSHALSQLRRLFEDPLLLKGVGEMIPTARAIELEPEVRRLIEGMDRLVRTRATFDPATAQGEFVIVAAENVEYLLAPSLIERLQHEAPGIDVQFRPPNLERALAMLERGEVDFRIGQWPKPPAQTLRCKMLYRDRLVCIARKEHPEISGGISLDAFLRAPHVRIKTPRIGPSMEALDRAIAKSGRLRVALHVHNAFAMSHVVSRSNLIACVTDRMARQLADKFPLQVLSLPLNLPDIRIGLYWHERTHRQPAHRWFRQVLAETAAAI